MKHSELSNFTYGELSNFTYSQLALDKFKLIEKISNEEIIIPDDVSRKLFDLCTETVQTYENITGEKVVFTPPSDKNKMSLKDKITCISLIFGILDKAMTNESIKTLLSDVYKCFVDFINTHIH